MDVKLVSTSGHQNLLKQLTKNGQLTNVYLLKTDKPEKIRVGYYKDRDGYIISHIDPPGGPRITVGKIIRDVDLPSVDYIVCIKGKTHNQYLIKFVE